MKTNSYEIFCTQPDCKHQTAAENADTKCSAVAPKEGYFYNYAFLYNDTLYSICTGELNEFLIYTADTDGMNRKLAFTAELSLCTMVNPVLDGGRLFFVGSEFEMNDTDSVGLRENYSLCSVDLSDFSFEKYMDIGTANETVIGKKSLLLYKNKIYFQHSEYSENSVHSAVECYDIDGSERMTVLEMEDSSTSGSATAVKCFMSFPTMTIPIRRSAPMISTAVGQRFCLNGTAMSAMSA